MTTARHRTPSTEVANAILDAATRILETEGVEALAIRRIASEAGVAPMSAYNHFASKAGIIDALYMEGFRRLGRAFEEAASLHDPIAALSEMGRRYRALGLEHPASYRLMFMDALDGYEPGEAAAATAEATFSCLVRAVSRCMETGAMEERDAHLAAQMIWATSHGWVSLEILGLNKVTDLDLGAAELNGMIIRGLAFEG